MPIVELTDQEWQALTLILAKQPWEVANPILFKMANMVRQNMPISTPRDVNWPRPDGAGEAVEGRSGL